ncbi:hypothetical protein PP713_17945 [Mycobacterium sp. CSUR Q5927]|nr:hypothetical protein [Mycobacterium sp. CSUR Q5927]
MTDPRELRPWQYPGKWFREEKFWFDMTTRTLSALTAAGVIALFAVIAGLGTHEQRINILRIIGVIVGALLFTVIYICIFAKRWDRYSRIDVSSEVATIWIGTHPKLRYQTKPHVLFDYAGVTGAIWRDHQDNLRNKLDELLRLDESQLKSVLDKSRAIRFYYLPDPSHGPGDPKGTVQKVNGLHYQQVPYIEVSKEEWQAARGRDKD